MPDIARWIEPGTEPKSYRRMTLSQDQSDLWGSGPVKLGGTHDHAKVDQRGWIIDGEMISAVVVIRGKIAGRSCPS